MTVCIRCKHRMHVDPCRSNAGRSDSSPHRLGRSRRQCDRGCTTLPAERARPEARARVIPRDGTLETLQGMEPLSRSALALPQALVVPASVRTAGSCGRGQESPRSAPVNEARAVPELPAARNAERSTNRSFCLSSPLGGGSRRASSCLWASCGLLWHQMPAPVRDVAT